MTTQTYSLEEYARLLLGESEPAQIQWLVKRLRTGALPGYKAARKWRATQADIDTAIDILRPRRVFLPELPQVGGMTRTSRRRLAS